MILANGAIVKRIFPVRMNTKGIPFGPPFDTDGSPMWKPFQERDPSPNEIAAWNRIAVPHNWALVLGRASDLVVIDVDPRHGGHETIKKYAVPLTFTIRTPGDGLHYYFACPPGGCASQPTFDQGIEIKGDGNIVLIPPSSKVVDGIKRRYEVVPGTETLPAAPLPAWAQARPRAVSPSKWRDAFRTVPRGQQNIQLTSLAGYLARTFPDELWPAIQEILWAIARRYPQDPHNPWTLENMTVIAESICATERTRRTSDAAKRAARCLTVEV